MKRQGFPYWVTLALCCSPLFLLTLNHWSSGILIGAAFVSIAYLLMSKRGASKTHPFTPQQWGVVWMFAGLALATGIGALLRGDMGASRQFDSPIRLVLAIPVFLLVLRTRAPLPRWLATACAASVVLTLGVLTLFPQPDRWGPGRAATAFADPLILGYTSLTFGLIVVASIFLSPHRSALGILVRLAVAMLAGYLSVISGSRTGWLALPILGIFFAAYHWKHLPKAALAGSTAAVVLCLAALWGYSDTVKVRVDAALEGVASYPQHGIAPDTPIALRITFLRMAATLFAQQPLTGYGDTYTNPPPVPASLAEYASPFAIKTALSSGFHNEVVTTAITSGLLAALAVLGLFLYPLIVFGRYLRSHHADARAAAHLGIIFVTCYGISSLTTEVFGLKYNVSFYAIVLALLLGACLQNKAAERMEYA